MSTAETHGGHRMRFTKSRALLLGIAVAAGSAVGCSSKTGPIPSAGEDESLGTVGLNLQLDPGVGIDTVNWTIHSSALLPADLTGSVDVSHSQAIQFVVGGLPVGDGYTVTLTAKTTGATALDCVGSGTFSIVA